MPFVSRIMYNGKYFTLLKEKKKLYFSYYLLNFGKGGGRIEKWHFIGVQMTFQYKYESAIIQGN